MRKAIKTHPPYQEIPIRSWAKFKATVTSPKFQSWAFRGQGDADWPLFSSLSRYFLKFGVHKDAWEQQESRILRIFRRKAHLLIQHLPPDGDSFEWLAMMQHHGSPTRLLDFSWSPFVAAFFALENANSEVAVWGLFPPGLGSKPTRTLRASQKVDLNEVAPWVAGSYEAHFLTNKFKITAIGEPQTMNQRLVAQHGTFVMPGVLDVPVDLLVPPNAIVKFVLDAKSIRDAAMADFYNMNIGNATLFPGLDGLARSLAYELESHWAFNPKTMKERKGFYLKD
jgi:hypothetical protein